MLVITDHLHSVPITVAQQYGESRQQFASPAALVLTVRGFSGNEHGTGAARALHPTAVSGILFSRDSLIFPNSHRDFPLGGLFIVSDSPHRLTQPPDRHWQATVPTHL